MTIKSFRKVDAKLCGVPHFEKTNELRRLNDNVLEAIPNLKEADRRLTGARLCFKTDAKELKINFKLENVYVDRGGSFYQFNMATAFIGERKNARFLGIISASNSYDENELYATFQLDGKMNEITVYFPRNPYVIDVLIGVNDEATIYPPTPFEKEKPFVFYGSSITENGHTASQNAYAALVSKYFDADFYNFGFSGMARGEIEMCDYLAKIEPLVFIYDYDHNAPSAEYLEKTHESFFKRYRSHFPTVPIIMMTKPYPDDTDTVQRREIIYKTYQNAVNSGDNNVYFIDGADYFKDVDREICTTDRTHPNDLGHYFMAQKIITTMKGFLK